MKKQNSTRQLIRVYSTVKVTPSTNDNLENGEEHSKLPHESTNIFPITCGFMLNAFLDSKLENSIRFMIDVDRLRDITKDSGARQVLPRKWEEIDDDVEILESGDPSSDLYMNVFMRTVTSILTNNINLSPTVVTQKDDLFQMQVAKIIYLYLGDENGDDDAPCKVDVPSDILDRTFLRMKYMSLYQEEVFGEALAAAIDTVPTLHGLFLMTPEYKQMVTHISATNPLPRKGSLGDLNPCESWIFAKPTDDYHWKGLVDEIHYNIDIYKRFLSYATHHGLEGCVLGCRLLHMFNDARYRFDAALSEEIAWKVYSHYVKVGSCYELHSLTTIAANEIMRNLAVPKTTMFANIKKELDDQCKAIFQDFLTSDRNYIDDEVTTPQCTFDSITDNVPCQSITSKKHNFRQRVRYVLNSLGNFQYRIRHQIRRSFNASS